MIDFKEEGPKRKSTIVKEDMTNTTVDDTWQLDVILREDISKCGVREWQPLCHNIKYIINNLTISSDGKLLVDVYLPETMTLIRGKMDINAFYILPTNRKYTWHALIMDNTKSSVENVMIIESYYCAANQPRPDDSVIGNTHTFKTEVLSYETKIILNNNVYVFSSKKSDIAVMNRMIEVSYMMPQYRQVPAHPYTGYTMNCENPASSFGNYYPYVDPRYTDEFIKRCNVINQKYAEGMHDLKKEKNKRYVPVVEDDLDFINKSDSED